MEHAQYLLKAVSKVYDYEEREAFYTKLAYNLIDDVDAYKISQEDADEFIQLVKRLISVDLVAYM